MNEMNNDFSENWQGSSSSEDDNLETYPPTLAGWIARIVSLSLLTCLAGVIMFNAVKPKIPVTFSAEMQTKDIRQNAGAYLVPIEITNEGSETALNVNVDIDIAGQITQIQLPMIGQKESMTFIISAKTKPKTFTHRIVSYEAP